MPEKYGTCKILTSHFNTGICKNSTYKVQIIEKLRGDGRTKRKAIDPEQTALRKKERTSLDVRTSYHFPLWA